MRGEYMNFFMQNWWDIWKACYPQEVSWLKNFTVEQTVNSIVIRVHFEDGSLAHTQSPYLRPSQLFEDVEKHIKENWDSMFSQGSFNSLPDLDPYWRIASQVAIGNDKTGRPIEISFTLRTAQEWYIHFSIRDPNTAPPIPIPLVPRS